MIFSSPQLKAPSPRKKTTTTSTHTQHHTTSLPPAKHQATKRAKQRLTSPSADPRRTTHPPAQVNQAHQAHYALPAACVRHRLPLNLRRTGPRMGLGRCRFSLNQPLPRAGASPLAGVGGDRAFWRSAILPGPQRKRHWQTGGRRECGCVCLCACVCVWEREKCGFLWLRVRDWGGCKVLAALRFALLGASGR